MSQCELLVDNEDPKRFVFERPYPDGGGCYFWGPHTTHDAFDLFHPLPGEEDEGDEGDRGETWYLCELVNNCSQSQLAA